MNDTYKLTGTGMILRVAAGVLSAAIFLLPAVSCTAKGDGAVSPSDLPYYFEDRDMEKSLDSFLDTFVKWYPLSQDGEWNYDCEKVSEGDVNMMTCIVSPDACVDWRLFSDMPEEDRFIEKPDDPRGWAASANAYYVFDAETADRIAREIFYVSDSDIDSLVSKAEASRRFYRHDGQYYVVYEGGTDSEVRMKNRVARLVDEKYLVNFEVERISRTYEGEVSYILYDCTAKMAYKSIGGRYYWSLYTFESRQK